MSLYDALGLKPGASAEEIKRAYRRKASKHHPDREGGDVGIFQLVQKAYDVLGDTARRAFYDEHGIDQNEGPSIRARALQTLASTITQMIADDESPFNIDHDDMVAKLRVVIHEGQAGIPERKAKAEKIIRKFENVLKRLKRNKKEGQDFIRTMLEKQISGIKLGIANLENEKVLGAEMLKILEEYHYHATIEQGSTAAADYGSIAGMLGSFRPR